jgi:hypothetical protein
VWQRPGSSWPTQRIIASRYQPTIMDGMRALGPTYMVHGRVTILQKTPRPSATVPSQRRCLTLATMSLSNVSWWSAQRGVHAQRQPAKRPVRRGPARALALSLAPGAPAETGVADMTAAFFVRTRVAVDARAHESRACISMQVCTRARATAPPRPAMPASPAAHGTRGLSGSLSRAQSAWRRKSILDVIAKLVSRAVLVQRCSRGFLSRQKVPTAPRPRCCRVAASASSPTHLAPPLRPRRCDACGRRSRSRGSARCSTR